MSQDPEADLVRACQSSEPHALEGVFRELYERFKDRIYNVCYRITGNPTDALDASQETFGILFRRIGEFRFQSRFSSWVYRIAVNASIDLRRRSHARPATSLDAVREARHAGAARIDFPDPSVEMPSHAASRHELEDEIQRAIDRLTPKLRAIIVLRYNEQLSYDEIAETLQISLGTVKSRLSRAHDALDRELTPVLDKHYLG
ncbi:MAG TPA: sigma-70 family RNA polymerase sigma factor [Planctomycetes bacterium]|nr:sigma-70 family RNA polymerase sigma factor [Planctomycetota bacterium]